MNATKRILLCVRTVLRVIYNGTHNVMANVSPKLMLDTSTSSLTSPFNLQSNPPSSITSVAAHTIHHTSNSSINISPPMQALNSHVVLTFLHIIPL